MIAWIDEPLECQASPGKMLVLFLLSLGMTLASFCCLVFSPDVGTQIAGGIGVLFFGVVSLITGSQATFKPPQLIFDEDGIYDSRLGCGLISWRDVRDLQFKTFQRNALICIEVENPKDYLLRMPPLKRWLAQVNRQFGFSTLTIGLTGMSPSVKEIKSVIKTNLCFQEGPSSSRRRTKRSDPPRRRRDSSR